MVSEPTTLLFGGVKVSYLPLISFHTIKNLIWMKDKSSAKGFYLSTLKNLFLNCASGGNGICQNWCISGIPKNVNKGADDVFTSNKYDYVQGVQYMLCLTLWLNSKQKTTFWCLCTLEIIYCIILGGIFCVLVSPFKWHFPWLK